MFIHVFKTDIGTQEAHETVAQILDSNSNIARWNIDKWDSENILRIESGSQETEEIIRSVNEAGYSCIALED